MTNHKYIQKKGVQLTIFQPQNNNVCYAIIRQIKNLKQPRINNYNFR